MTNPKAKPVNAFRLSAADSETIDDVAKRLKVSRTTVVELALHGLRVRMGLLRDDAALLYDRIARMHGDDATLTFTVASVPEQRADVTIDGQPLADVRAHLMFAMTGTGDSPEFKLPPVASILMKDQQAGALYNIGHIELAEGAAVALPLRRLPECLAGERDDDRTPEQRRSDLHMSELIRRAARSARGVSEGDGEETDL